MAALTTKSKLQIYSLMKARHTLTEIARLLGRHRSTISREIDRGRGGRGYRAEQACTKPMKEAKAVAMRSAYSLGYGLRWRFT